MIALQNRGIYQKYTPKQKATIGNYALINGTSAALKIVIARDSSPLTSVHVLQKLQCKQLRIFFLRNFSLLEYVDFYKN